VSRPLWWDDPEVTAAMAAPRPSLQGDTEADVAIVGGGFTGLWTALHVLRDEPSARVLVIERHVCGFGASGRNGGWAIANFAGSREVTARRHGREAAIAMQRAMFGAVDGVGRTAEEEGIDCHFVKGGTVTLARSPAHERRLRARVEDERSWGFEDDFVWLDPAATAARVEADGVLGAVYTPHCARLHPARLVVGLAAAVERRGGVIVEQTAVEAIEAGLVRSAQGDVRSPVIVRANEGFTRDLAGLRRRLVPMHSMMIATEPLPPDVWDRIGLRERETLTDGRYLVVYAQRTADGRVAIGGSVPPYYFGSHYRTSFPDDHPVFVEVANILRDILPPTAGATVTHSWGGPLGIPRDWYPSVGIDRATGVAWGGGYVGDGVAASYLAGRTLAALILEQETDDTALPWVDHPSRSWEPEPLRWLGIRAGQRLVSSVDDHEARTGAIPRRRTAALRTLIGE
jgi:glycine/D-amino acid oxidase-like deaminating enzyme